MSQTRASLAAAGKELIRREDAYAGERAIDDARHIPRLDRIAGAMAEAGKKQDLSEREADGLREELVDYGRELWVRRCLSHVPEDVDRETYRRETAEIFEEVRTAEDPVEALYGTV